MLIRKEIVHLYIAKAFVIYDFQPVRKSKCFHVSASAFDLSTNSIYYKTIRFDRSVTSILDLSNNIVPQPSTDYYLCHIVVFINLLKSVYAQTKCLFIQPSYSFLRKYIIITYHITFQYKMYLVFNFTQSRLQQDFLCLPFSISKLLYLISVSILCLLSIYNITMHM